MDATDAWTKVLDRALDIVFVKYPARTGLGVILGCVFSFLVRLFQPTLASISFADFSGAPWWGWIPIGVIIMHVPTILTLFKQQPIGNDSIDQALDLIERANFTQSERRQQYRNLLDRVASNVALSQDAQREVKALERAATQEDGDI